MDLEIREDALSVLDKTSGEVTIGLEVVSGSCGCCCGGSGDFYTRYKPVIRQGRPLEDPEIRYTLVNMTKGDRDLVFYIDDRLQQKDGLIRIGSERFLFSQQLCILEPHLIDLGQEKA